MNPGLQTRFGAAVDAALAGATVVTSTTRAARMLIAEALRRSGAGQRACRTPDILPLGAFYQRLWGDALAMGVAAEALLSPQRALALWRKLIAQSRHAEALSVYGSAGMAQDAWATAHAYRIALDARAFRGVVESAAFFEWASLYKEECQQGAWVDAAVLPDALLRQLDPLGDILPKHLVVYGFPVLTPQDQEFCRGLAARGVRVETLSLDAECGSAKVVIAEALADELRLAATWARRNLIVDVSQRIGIVVPRLREIPEQVDAVFAEVLHPEEFVFPAATPNRAFEIAAGMPLDQYPLVRDALAILRFTFAEIPVSDIGVLLRSPYVGEVGETSARAMFDVALRRNGREQYSAHNLPTVAGEGSRRVLLPRDFTRRVRQMANLRTPPTKLLAPNDAAEQFHRALVAADWPSRELESGEYQLREKWEDLLGEFASLDGFVAPRTAADLVDELARMAAGVSFRPENSGAPVQIMDDAEAAGAVFDRLWVCGMNDEWPRPSRPNPYLPLALQRDAGIPCLTPAQQQQSAAAAIARFTSSASEVIFSWPRHERDREFRGNRLLLPFAAADPAAVSGPAPPTCASAQRVTAELEYVNDQKAPAADVPTLPRRGTEVLKYQARCPFRAFAQLRLGAEQLETPKLGLDNRVRGKLVEKALEIFWGHMRDSVNLRDLTPSQRLNEVLDDSVEKAFAFHWPEVEAEWNRRLRQLERRRLRELLRQWCEIELTRREDFEVVLHEQQKEIKLQLGPLEINGRIDRVDKISRGGFVVIDYKSGAKPTPASWTSERPDDPQLPLYAVYQLEQGREVLGVAFGHVTAADPSWKGHSDPLTVLGFRRDNFKRYLNGSTWREYVRAWRLTLQRLAETFVDGDAVVDPKDPPKTCNWCHLHGLCRVAEVSFDESDDDAGNGGDDE